MIRSFSIMKPEEQTFARYGNEHTQMDKLPQNTCMTNLQQLKVKDTYKRRRMKVLMDWTFKVSVTSDSKELDDWFWTHEGWFHLDGYINFEILYVSYFKIIYITFLRQLIISILECVTTHFGKLDPRVQRNL
jgi:hypothetical protein